MKTWKTISLLSGFLIFGALATFGLEGVLLGAGADGAEAAAGCVGCLCPLAVFGLIFAIDAACGYFVYTDATKNGVDNAVLWAVIAFFTNWIGTLIYFLVIKKQHMEKQGK